jgi:hypothetical protein
MVGHAAVNPLQVLQSHEMRGEGSCVSWGLEYILKMHDKIPLSEYPIQTAHPSDLGFGQEAADLLGPHDIASREEHYELSEFEAKMADEVAAARSPIFSVPDHLVVDYQNRTARIVFHVWTPAMVHDSLQYLSRGFGRQDILSPLPVGAVFDAVRKQLVPDYRIHCLLYELR